MYTFDADIAKSHEDEQNMIADEDDSNVDDEIQFQFKLRAEAKSIKHFLFVLEQKLYLTSLVTKSMTKTDDVWMQADIIFFIMMKSKN